MTQHRGLDTAWARKARRGLSQGRGPLLGAARLSAELWPLQPRRGFLLPPLLILSAANAALSPPLSPHEP